MPPCYYQQCGGKTASQRPKMLCKCISAYLRVSMQMLERTEIQKKRERGGERETDRESLILLQNAVESTQTGPKIATGSVTSHLLPPGVVLNIVPPGVVEYSWGMWAESCTATRRTAGMSRPLLLWLPADMLSVVCARLAGRRCCRDGTE